jgi:tetratricopeptide (TPR) repeat protein
MAGWLRRLLGTTALSPGASGVHADRGGIAAGRDIRDNTINIGLNENEIQRQLAPLADQMAALAEQVSREKGIPLPPLRAALEKLGESNIPEHEILNRINFAADQLLELRARVARAGSDRPEFVVIRQRVLGSIDRGDLESARAILQRARQSARALRLTREEAESIANEGFIDQLQRDYRAAATKYAEAADLVGTFDPEGVWGLLMHQADALSAYGSEFGDNQALEDAAAIYRKCLTLAPRPKRPLDWAASNNALGIVLSKLGERESGTDRLREAVESYRDALNECTRERAPSDWGSTNNNLGNALTALGEREGDIEMLRAAIVAYEDALKQCTRERVPLEWANIQSNLGTTFQVLGKYEDGTARLQQSVDCYNAALTERTRERVPLDWAMTQNNLGNTLNILSDREQSVDRLQASIACFLEALKERTRERVPLDWAATASNVGMALVRFGSLERNPHRIQAGIDALRDALSVFEQSGASRYIFGTKKNFGPRKNGPAKVSEVGQVSLSAKITPR